MVLGGLASEDGIGVGNEFYNLVYVSKTDFVQYFHV